MGRQAKIRQERRFAVPEVSVWEHLGVFMRWVSDAPLPEKRYARRKERKLRDMILFSAFAMARFEAVNSKISV